MTREIKALQLSCAIHAILVFAIMAAVRTASVPLRIDLMDFTMLGTIGEEMSAPAIPGPDRISPATSSVEPAEGATPPIIKQRRQKVAVLAPRQEALSDETPHAEPALSESFLKEESREARVESATKTDVPRPVASSSDLAELMSPVQSNSTGIAKAVSRGTVSGTNSLTSQEQYLSNHFAGIRGRIIRHLSYPAVARKKGWEGQVRLCFRIDHEGGVEAITVLASSGYALLDRRAMDVVRQVAPFPKPLEHAEIIMPITFSLRQ